MFVLLKRVFFKFACDFDVFFIMNTQEVGRLRTWFITVIPTARTTIYKDGVVPNACREKRWLLVHTRGTTPSYILYTPSPIVQDFLPLYVT